MRGLELTLDELTQLKVLQDKLFGGLQSVNYTLNSDQKLINYLISYMYGISILIFPKWVIKNVIISLVIRVSKIINLLPIKIFNNFIMLL